MFPGPGLTKFRGCCGGKCVRGGAFAAGDLTNPAFGRWVFWLTTY